MNNIIIRELRPEDLERIYYLLCTRDELDDEGARKRTKLMEWCAFKNPHADKEPTYFVAEENGEIVAYIGRMPTEFVINGEGQKGYQNHDLYVHPEYREKGMGFFLSMSLFKANEDSTESFCCSIFMSNLTLELLRRRGYYELKAGCFFKVLKTEGILKTILRYKTLAKIIGSTLGKAFDLIDYFIISIIPSYRDISKINRFDSQYDKFYQSILGKVGNSSYKESSYLNWKLIDRPYSKIDILAAYNGDEVQGYVILSPNLGKDYPEGMIVDIIADPQDKRTIVSLVKASIKHFRQKKVFGIRCCVTDERVIKILRKFIFLPLRRGEPVMLGNLDKLQQKEVLMNIDNWYLTYSETDELMLRP